MTFTAREVLLAPTRHTRDEPPVSVTPGVRNLRLVVVGEQQAEDTAAMGMGYFWDWEVAEGVLLSGLEREQWTYRLTIRWSDTMNALTLESLASRGSEIGQALGESASAQPSGPDSNRQAYEKMKSELQRRFPGEWVAFVDGQFAGHDRDRARLLDRLYAAHPGRLIFYKKPVDREPLYRLTSPRRA